MKSAKLFLLFLSIIIINNCSYQEVKINAVASPDQMTDYEGVVTSEKQHVVSLAYYESGMLKDRTKFIIIVENYGDKPVDFSNDNISVMFEGDSIDWSSKEIYIETPMEVMWDIQKEFRARNMRNMRIQRVGSGGISTNSGAASSLSSISGGGSFSPRQSSINSSGAMQMRMAKIKSFGAQSFYAIPRVIIRPQIIMPNESISGFFVCDTSEMKDTVEGNFIISIKVDEEEHKFIFSRSLSVI